MTGKSTSASSDPDNNASQRRHEEVLGEGPRLQPLTVEELDGNLLAMINSMISVTEAIDARGKELLTDKQLENEPAASSENLQQQLASLPEILRTMLRHPDLFLCHTRIGLQLLGKGTLPARERELVVLRIGWLCQAPYEWGEHVHVGKGVGLTSDDIVRITQGPDVEGWCELDRALLQAVDELYRNAMISDPTWQLLEKHLSEQQLIELPILVGQYQTVAYYQNSLRLRLHEGNQGLKAR